MRDHAAAIVVILAAVTVACSSDGDPKPGIEVGTTHDTGGSGGGAGGGPLFDELDKDRAQATFKSTTDLMRYIYSPTCAAENNECHNNEDFPDMSSEGNLWNLIGTPCNVTVGERETIEDFCEQVGDELQIDGTFTATIGSIATMTDAQGEFVSFHIELDKQLTQQYAGANWVVMRNGVPRPELGNGNSLGGANGASAVDITDANEIPETGGVHQGDENMNDVYGDGTGFIIVAGDSHASYMVRRLTGQETTRERMPLNENADNPTEVNNILSPDEMYAVMSWINCIEPGDGVYSDIHYGCSANESNEGRW